MQRQSSWGRILAEGLVVVLSILLALAADAWWDGRQDRAQEAALLRSVQAETAENLERLQTWEDGLGRAAELAKAMLGRAGPRAEPMPAAEFDSLVLEALTFRTYHPTTGAVNAALAQLQLIRSDALRQEIAGFQQRFGDFRENFEWRLDEGLVLVEYLQDAIPLFTADNVAWTEAAPGPDRQAILRDVKFANLMGGVVYRTGRMTTEAADFRAYLEGLIALTEAEAVR